MVVRSKRLKAAYQSFDKMIPQNVAEAIRLIIGNKKTKFDETIEISMNLGVDPRHADQMVRGVVALPNGTGKSVRVLRGLWELAWRVFEWVYAVSV